MNINIVGNSANAPQAIALNDIKSIPSSLTFNGVLSSTCISNNKINVTYGTASQKSASYQLDNFKNRVLNTTIKPVATLSSTCTLDSGTAAPAQDEKTLNEDYPAALTRANTVKYLGEL